MGPLQTAKTQVSSRTLWIWIMQSQLRHWRRRQNGRWLRGSAEELVSVWRQWLLLVVAGFRVLQEQHADRQAKAGCLAPQNHEHWSMQGGKGAHDHRGAELRKIDSARSHQIRFGKAAVLGKPKLGAANDALSRMAKETSVLYILTITGQWIMQRIQKKILLCQSPTS